MSRPPERGMSSLLSQDEIYLSAAYRLAVVAPAACARQLAHGCKRQPPGGKRAVVRRLAEMMAETEAPGWLDELADDIRDLAAFDKRERRDAAAGTV